MHSMQFNIRISSNCINCIRCVAVCPSHVLVRNSANRMVEVGSLGRCIGCGQCAIDAANILKPSLARGELQIIGATTIEDQ